jgi:hypothetical protein
MTEGSTHRHPFEGFQHAMAAFSRHASGMDSDGMVQLLYPQAVSLIHCRLSHCSQPVSDLTPFVRLAGVV